MGSNQQPVHETATQSSTDRLKSIASTVIDWVTIKPVWHLYRRYGRRGGIGGLAIVFFLAYFGIAILLAVPWSILDAIGLASTDSLPPTAMALAVLVVAYAGYRAYTLVSTRKKLFQYQQQPTYENAAKAFAYFDHEDAESRAMATFTVADVIEDNPGRLIKQANLSPEEAAFEIADLLHDDNEKVRINGAHALTYMARDFPDAVMNYRDDVFAAIKYPNSAIQGNAAIAAGNLAYNEPELAEEVLQHVETLCDDPDHEVREMACVALGHISHERAAALLDRLVDDPNPSVREAAAEAIEMHRQDQRVEIDTEPEPVF